MKQYPNGTRIRGVSIPPFPICYRYNIQDYRGGFDVSSSADYAIRDSTYPSRIQEDLINWLYKPILAYLLKEMSNAVSPLQKKLMNRASASALAQFSFYGLFYA